MVRSRSISIGLLALCLLVFCSFVAAAATEFHGCWPYLVPPQGHFNTFATNNINLGMYWDMMEQPMGIY